MRNIITINKKPDFLTLKRNYTEQKKFDDEQRELEETQKELVRYRTFEQNVCHSCAVTNFNIERFVEITSQDKINLLLLRMLNNLQWYVKSRSLTDGQSIGDKGLSWGSEEPRAQFNEIVMCDSP